MVFQRPTAPYHREEGEAHRDDLANDHKPKAAQYIPIGSPVATFARAGIEPLSTA